MAKILIVDDDRTFCTQFSLYIEEMGHSWSTADTLNEALAKARTDEYDIVLLDVFLPDANGLSAISEFKKIPTSPEVIIVTGQGDPEAAETALKSGAWHYVEKPPAFQTMELLISRALSYRQGKKQLLEQKLFNRDLIIGNDTKLIECLRLVAKAAGSQGNVLITGETGTGKELFAKAIHKNSQRSDHRFVAVDCTNITPSLASSILFGYKKGAYTGATRDDEGLIKQADGGTLFLDEVGDLPEETQKSLLRVLQNKSYLPLGGKNEVACDFRVISATNRDLKSELISHKFREDLYFRLAAFHIHLPPLRERPNDIHLIASHYISQICTELGIDTKGVSKDFLEALSQYHWPGNIRELVNVLRSSISESMEEPVLYPHSLPVDLRIHALRKNMEGKHPHEKAKESATPAEVPAEQREEFLKYKMFHDQMEAQYLTKLLSVSKRDIPKACEISGLSRARLYQLFKKHGMRRTRD